MVQLTFFHEVEFVTEDKISVRDVADSLIANEEFVLSIGRILEFCFDGLKIEKIDVAFRKTSTESPLKEMLFVSIVSVYQDDMEKAVPIMIEAITGLTVPEKYASLVTILVLFLVIYGMDWAYKRFISRRVDSTAQTDRITHIQGNFNTILNNTGTLLAVAPEKLLSAVEETLTNQQKDSLAKRALEFIRPAKNEYGASIRGGGIEITREAINQVPTALDYAQLDDDELQEPYTHQLIEIHAADRDRSKAGWAAHLPGLHEKRLKMQIFPTIDTRALFGRSSIRGDIILVSKRDNQGNYLPYLFHLLRVYDGD